MRRDLRLPRSGGALARHGGPYRALCRLSSAFDARIVDGLVNAAGFSTDMAGEVARLAQTGYVRNYALGFFAGAVVILWYVLR